MAGRQPAAPGEGVTHKHPCSFCGNIVPCADNNCHTRNTFICDRCNERHLKGLGGVVLANEAEKDYRRRTGGNP